MAYNPPQYPGPPQQWGPGQGQQGFAPQGPPNQSGRGGRTAGIVVAVVAVLLVLVGGGVAVGVLLSPGQVLAAPSDSICAGLESEIDSDFNAEVPDYELYSTCGWSLDDPNGASDDSLNLDVDYETVEEGVGGASPVDLAQFLVRRNHEESSEAVGDYRTPTREELSGIGDEAYYSYRAYESVGYSSYTSYATVRRQNVVITVSVYGARGDYDNLQEIPESDLRPLTERMAEAAVRHLERRSA